MDKKISFSFENTQRVMNLQTKVGSMIESVVRDIGKKGIHEANKAIYEAAEARGISVWDLCYMFAPVTETKEIWNQGSETPNVTWQQTIRLVPIEFEFDKWPGYWKKKYYELKRQMQAIIDNKDI